MAQTLLEMTKDLTRTLVETGMLSAEDMQDALQKTHATLPHSKRRKRWEPPPQGPLPGLHRGTGEKASPDTQ